MSIYDSSICKDCGVDVNGIHELCYINDPLWQTACNANPKIDPRYVLCIGCIEKRICRTLIPKDFTDCELNGYDLGRPKSNRLKQRLGWKSASLRLHS